MFLSVRGAFGDEAISSFRRRLLRSLLTFARNDMQHNYTFLFFLFFRLLSAPCGNFVGPLVPLLKHGRDATFAPIPAPWAMMTPTPAWTPEEEAEGQE